MDSLEELQTRLKLHIDRWLIAIQNDRVVDVGLFDKIEQDAREVARLLKGSTQLPRSPLFELHGAIRILRAEAPHFDTLTDSLLQMADELETTFDLILQGESHEDRFTRVCPSRA